MTFPEMDSNAFYLGWLTAVRCIYNAFETIIFFVSFDECIYNLSCLHLHQHKSSWYTHIKRPVLKFQTLSIDDAHFVTQNEGESEWVSESDYGMIWDCLTEATSARNTIRLFYGGLIIMCFFWSVFLMFGMACNSIWLQWEMRSFSLLSLLHPWNEHKHQNGNISYNNNNNNATTNKI